MIQQMNTVEIANLVFSIVTTLCVLYLSVVALKHSARPKAKVRMLSPGIFPCSEECLFIFELSNVGHWYAKPAAINVVVFCNFDPGFELIELLYGSAQSFSNTEIRIGVGNMRYLKAKGLKLIYGEEGEEVHVRARTPQNEGKYRIRISAFSENGVSIKKEFTVTCRNP